MTKVTPFEGEVRRMESITLDVHESRRNASFKGIDSSKWVQAHIESEVGPIRQLFENSESGSAIPVEMVGGFVLD
jgi:hypothetical protein